MGGKKKPPIYFLLHAPKCAGSTIEAHLSAYLPKHRLWMPEPASAVEMLCGRRYSRKDMPDLRGIQVLTGHWLGRSLERHFPDREIRRTVLLRDPVSFQLSFYNFRMTFLLSRGHPTSSFEQHLRQCPRDVMAIFLLWIWLEVPVARLAAISDERKYRLLNEALAGFWFVGSYKDCDRLIAAIAPDLNVPSVSARTNTARYWQTGVRRWDQLRAEDLPPSVTAAIRARNPIHQALWENWRDAAFDTGGTRPQPLPPVRGGRIGLAALLKAGLFARRIGISEPLIEPLWGPAVRASRAGDWPLAIRLFREALQTAPGFPEVWRWYGAALLEIGDAAAAEKAYRRAIELDDVTETHLHHGRALQLLGRNDEARAAFLRFQNLDPAAFQRKFDELVASGRRPEEISAFWRSVVESGD